ncbi:zinc-binding dehydrogenase [Acidiferrimicrobium sp. IK]|uniref:zinc-binding dehydrogenase n=1 Tax=Acidiferrimicrobium sp. IK TaxID=2871700 RepID=UPI0021CB7EB3|nr:zinc-binding dehydrogenase [Acidiferrimicrobium sp. IK]MCU4183239.1 zinc-binding dehydrogenase [Acidiferrimicrobium sp. IK]
MRAVVCKQLGAVADLVVEDVEDPVAGAGEVLVAVEAAGVTYVDALLVGGRYQFPVPVPFVPGAEVAGRVAALGEDVFDLAVGERVVAQARTGGFAETLVTGRGQVWRLPDGVAAGVGATVLQSYMTTVYELTRRDPLRAGEKILVLGAGGGVGLAAVDVAVGLGAQVIAAASSADKRAAAMAAGAFAAVDTLNEDLKTRVRELSGGGVDVVVDPVGGELAEPALRALAFGGRYHVVGFAGGPIPKIPLNLVLLNSRTVVGVELGGVLPRRPGLGQEITEEVLSGVADGRFHPTEPRMLPLEQAGEALDALLGRRVTGKLALAPSLAPG